MQTGDVLELDITGVAHGGVFVARQGASDSEPGRVVFVPDTLPGERVRARVTQIKKSFARAETLEVLEASAHRRPHVWAQADVAVPPAERPGGADFGHIELGHQRELKTRVLREAFERFARGAVPTAVASAGPDETPDGTRWRTRVSLHVDTQGRVGPFAARSHDVVEVSAHPLATSAIERAALGLAGFSAGRVDLVEAADGEVTVVPRPARRARGRAPRRAVVSEVVGGRTFRVDADGFWQVHRLAAGRLDQVVREALAELEQAEGAHHLDLYGGVGLFAAALAEHGSAARVTTVESAPRATEHARENLAGVDARAVTARVEDFVEVLADTADAGERAALARGVTLLDPPRSGAGLKVVEAIARLEPAAVIYVACDPVALARDVGAFRALGYDTDRVRGLDLFPSSHHVESVCVLRRA
ncbi:class I SAM-dependent RNA methyltransferase [Microbacterium excoecariae]|uniref:class I SAM-dependent RNA methyltransferase n=1 Tax=Microbacterium excoecariae TaxID=2715210 RepID=UPI001407CEA0|nr:TRAM domain-containing protein [Microbacterium excoecariae]NHI17490.1 class I SAM-dependent RNA methyltransferase [Microbacterium excoecariae]